MDGVAAEDHIGRTMREIVPDVANLAEQLAAKIVKTGEPILGIEIESRTKDQPGVSRSWIEHWSPVKGANGQVTSINVVVEEVTEQKRTLAALQASEARLREVLDAVKDGFVVLDFEFRITAMNKEALRIDGRTLESLLGRTHWEVWPASVGTPVEDAYRRVMTHRLPVSIVHHYYSLLHDVWLEIAAYPTTDGIAIFYRDITHKKQTEELLRERKRRLATALRAGRLGVFEYHFGPPPSYDWDDIVRDICGIGPQVTITDELYWLVVHPDDRRKIHDAFKRGCDLHGDHRYEVDCRVFRQSDGLLRWIRVYADVFFAAGKANKVIGTVQDITDRKLAEEQAQLLTREVTHRSKNLLSVVQSVARQMAKNSDPVTFAERFSERLQGLAASHDLLVHSQWRGVALADLVKSQLDHYRDLIGSRIQLSGPLLRVSAAAAQTLGMALHELATNAAKYGALTTETGHLTIMWHVCASETGERLYMNWTESGGPSVQPATHKGLGSRIITGLVEQALQGTVTVNYEPSGFQWTVLAPAQNVLEQA